MSVPAFTVVVDGDFPLEIDQIWPDGDTPENPTPEDVAAVMRKCGGRLSVLLDWSLEPRVLVYRGHGAERAEVWP
jgi:hypothetical protein